MKLDTLRQAEALFLDRYPGGFDHPEIVAIGKKHRMDQLTAQAREHFAKAAFDDPSAVLAAAPKFMGRSSMVSMFEKPKYRDFIAGLTPAQGDAYVQALYDQLHGKKAQGFTDIVRILDEAKLAKWPLVTAIPSYLRPTTDVFVKPNTTKLVLRKLDIDLDYHPRPTWDFYRAYRDAVNELKTHVAQELSPSNAAFMGFLMMTLAEV